MPTFLRRALHVRLLVLTIVLSAVSAGTFAQLPATRLSLNFKNVPLKDIFNEIISKTGFNLFYSNQQIDEQKKISVRVTNASVSDVLKMVLGSSYTWTAKDNVINIKKREVSAPPALDQADTTQGVSAVANMIRGVVTDDKGEALPGAGIKLKGLDWGTITNESGYYELKDISNGNGTLEVSYVGFESRQLAIRNRSAISISLSRSVANLTDMVVVGYGTLRKSDITGSSSRISESTIKETPATTMENALQGRLAGVNITNTSSEPGGGISIQVRGISSLSASTQPLYVIDGVPQFNDNSRSAQEPEGYSSTNFLATLNPADIESVEVLKDASSAAIYGSRAANGVIMITTKKGKSGKAVIDFGYYAMLGEKPRSIPLATAREFASFMNATYANVGQAPIYDGTYKKASNNTDSLYFPRPEELGEGTDWQSEIFRNALTHNFQMSVSGGREDLKYFISGNYLSDEGVVKYSRYNKGSLRTNLDATFNDRLSAKININIATDLNDRAESSNSNTTPGGFTRSGVIQKAFLASPAMTTDNQAYRVYLLLADKGAASGLINPLLDLAHTINQRRNTYVQANADLIYKFNRHLNFTVRGAYNYTDANNDMFWGLETELGYDRGQRTFQSSWKSASYINENFLTYNLSNSTYNLNVVAGTTFQKEIARGGTQEAEILSIPSDNGLYLLPLYANVLRPTSNRVESLLLSGFGRASFSYLNKYLLTVTGRADGSSKFAENQKWAFFPSVGLGWNFSEESFAKNGLSILTAGKLRASYGTSGNQAISPYQSLASLTPLSYGGYNGPVTGVVTYTSENKDLTWETTKQLDLGLDLGFAQNRLRLSFDFYRKTTNNLLQSKSIPSESGYSVIVSNFGSIRNTGGEAELGATIVTNKRFTWNADFNASVNRNKILDLGEGVKFYNGASGSADYTHRLTVGGSLGDFWGYATNGLLTAQDITSNTPRLGGSTAEGDLRFVDQDKNGLINDEDKIKLGNAYPRITLGLANNFTLGNWTLNVFLQGVLGQDVMNQNLLYSSYGSYLGVPSQKYLSDYWTPQNKGAYYPRPSAAAVNNVTTDRLIENAGYVRIKNVALRYNFPKMPSWVRKLQVYLTASNLYTFTGYDGYDPEVSGYGQNVITPGIDIGSYPRTRLWTVGVDFGF